MHGRMPQLVWRLIVATAVSGIAMARLSGRAAARLSSTCAIAARDAVALDSMQFFLLRMVKQADTKHGILSIHRRWPWILGVAWVWHCRNCKVGEPVPVLNGSKP